MAAMSGAEPVVVQAADGKLTLPAPAKGVWYIATRAADDVPWQRVGVLLVQSLVDEVREKLVSEIADLDKRVVAAEAVQFQVSDPTGSAVTRVNLPALRAARSRAEQRLRDYDRRRVGIPPFSFG